MLAMWKFIFTLIILTMLLNNGQCKEVCFEKIGNHGNMRHFGMTCMPEQLVPLFSHSLSSYKKTENTIPTILQSPFNQIVDKYIANKTI